MAVPKNYKYLALQVRHLWQQHEERVVRDALHELAAGAGCLPLEQAGGSSPSWSFAIPAAEDSTIKDLTHSHLEPRASAGRSTAACELGLQALADVLAARMRQALRRWDMFTRRQRLEDLESTVLQALGTSGPGSLPTKGAGLLPGAGLGSGSLGLLASAALGSASSPHIPSSPTEAAQVHTGLAHPQGLGTLAVASLAGQALAEGTLGSRKSSLGSLGTAARPAPLRSESVGGYSFGALRGHSLGGLQSPGGHSHSLAGGSLHSPGGQSDRPAVGDMRSPGDRSGRSHSLISPGGHSRGLLSPGALHIASLAGQALAEGGGTMPKRSPSPAGGHGGLAAVALAGRALAEGAGSEAGSRRSSSSPPQQRTAAVTVGMGALAGEALMEAATHPGDLASRPSTPQVRVGGVLSLAAETLMERGSSDTLEEPTRQAGIARHSTLATASLASQALMEGKHQSDSSNVRQRVAYLERVIGEGVRQPPTLSPRHEDGSRSPHHTAEDKTPASASPSDASQSHQQAHASAREPPRALVGRGYCGKEVRLRSKERQVRLKERRHGAEHPEVVLALMSLADHHRRFGSADRRRAALEKALHVQEKLHGADHLLLVDSLLNLAGACRDLGDLATEESLLARKDSILAAHMERQPRSEPEHLGAEGLLRPPTPQGSAAELVQTALRGETRVSPANSRPSLAEPPIAASTAPRHSVAQQPAGNLSVRASRDCTPEREQVHTPSQRAVEGEGEREVPQCGATSAPEDETEGGAQQTEKARLLLLEDRLRALEAEVAAEARKGVKSSVQAASQVEELLRAANNNSAGKQNSPSNDFVQGLCMDQARIDEVIKLASVLWDSGLLGSLALPAQQRRPPPLLQASLLGRLADRCLRVALREALHLWWRHSLLQQSVEELVSHGALQRQPKSPGSTASQFQGLSTTFSTPRNSLRRTNSQRQVGQADPFRQTWGSRSGVDEDVSGRQQQQQQQQQQKQQLYTLEGGVSQQAAKAVEALLRGDAVEQPSWREERAVSRPALQPSPEGSPEVELAKLQAELRATKAAEEAAAAAAAALATSEARAQTSESAALEECERLREQLRQVAVAQAEAEREPPQRLRISVSQDPAALPATATIPAPDAAVQPAAEQRRQSEVSDAQPSSTTVEGEVEAVPAPSGALAAAEAFLEAATKEEEEDEDDDDAGGIPGMESSDEDLVVPKRSVGSSQLEARKRTSYQSTPSEDAVVKEQSSLSTKKKELDQSLLSGDGEDSDGPMDGDDLADLLG